MPNNFLEKYRVLIFYGILVILLVIFLRKKANGMSLPSSIQTKKLPTQMSVSTNGRNHFIEYEGKRSKAYKDSAGLWTIGIGHLIKSNEQHLKTATLSDAEIYAMFDADVLTARKVVENKIKVPVTQGLYDALVSLAFNTGTIYNHVIEVVNTGDYKAIAEHWKTTAITINNGATIVQGLVNRRLSESELFYNA